MADKNITLHPLNEDGSIKTDENLYPKTKPEQVIGLNDTYATKAYASETYLSKDDASTVYLSKLEASGAYLPKVNPTVNGIITLVDQDGTGGTITSDAMDGAILFDSSREMQLRVGNLSDLGASKIYLDNGEIQLSCAGENEEQEEYEFNVNIGETVYIDGTGNFTIDCPKFSFPGNDFFVSSDNIGLGLYSDNFGHFVQIIKNNQTNISSITIGNINGTEVIDIDVPINNPNNAIALYKESEIANKAYVDLKYENPFFHHLITINCLKSSGSEYIYSVDLCININLSNSDLVNSPAKVFSLANCLQYVTAVDKPPSPQSPSVVIINTISKDTNEDVIIQPVSGLPYKIVSVSDTILQESY